MYCNLVPLLLSGALRLVGHRDVASKQANCAQEEELVCALIWHTHTLDAMYVKTAIGVESDEHHTAVSKHSWQ